LAADATRAVGGGDDEQVDTSWIADALQQAPVARLGTLGSDGAVRLVPICFAIVDGWLAGVVDDKPKRTTELRRLDDLEATRTATVLVDHYEDDWTRLWWVRIRGRAVVHRRRDDDALAALAALTAKYPQYRRDPPTGAVYRIAMDEVRCWRARAAHWDGVYTTRSSNEVSWYEREPATSLELIAALDLDRSAAIVDVGSGASTLADHLLAAGYTDLTLLDISARALEEVGARLGQRAAGVTLVTGDVLDWRPDRSFDLWHDRAVFHFLVDPGDRMRYIELAARTVRRGGALVLAGFAEDGPTHCSGLPVTRNSADDLAASFAPAFTPVAHGRELHTTPTGVVQPFTWVTLRRS
jgi:PPOX class probable F420-dependent enzyme